MKAAKQKPSLACTKELPKDKGWEEDFLSETTEVRKHIQRTERKKKIIQLRFVYLATLSFKNEDEIIVFFK